VQHLGRGDDHAHLRPDRNDQRLIDFEQIVLALRRVAQNLIAWGSQRAEERDALALAGQVFVTPFPLVARDFDREVGRGGVAHLDQRLRGGDRHADQDKERDDGPDHFHRRILVEVSGLVAYGLAVLDDGVEHEAEYADEDQHANPQDQIV
jgi:hypothetical protein